MKCGSYSGIKLLEHATKVVERIFEHRIQQQIDIDDMQFGFMKAVLPLLDLEKAFCRVLREVIR